MFLASVLRQDLAAVSEGGDDALRAGAAARWGISSGLCSALVRSGQAALQRVFDLDKALLAAEREWT